MDVSSIGNIVPSHDEEKGNNKVAQQKLEEKRAADKAAEKRKKEEEALLNPVDRAQVTDQTHALGQSIAASIISSVL